MSWLLAVSFEGGFSDVGQRNERLLLIVFALATGILAYFGPYFLCKGIYWVYSGFKNKQG